MGVELLGGDRAEEVLEDLDRPEDVVGQPCNPGELPQREGEQQRDRFGEPTHSLDPPLQHVVVGRLTHVVAAQTHDVQAHAHRGSLLSAVLRSHQHGLDHHNAPLVAIALARTRLESSAAAFCLSYCQHSSDSHSSIR